jgi:hypothetical protein
MDSPLKRTFLATPLAVAALLATAGSGRANTIIDILPPETYIAGFGERVQLVANNTSYVAQSFVAPAASALDTVEFQLQQQSAGLDNAADNVFHLLITTTVGGTELSTPTLIRPATVLFESGDLTMALAGGTQLFSVNVGSLPLVDGATYAFVLDAFVTADTLPGKSAVGAVAHDTDPLDTTSYNGGHLFSLNLTDAQLAQTRAQHFSATWNDTVDHDIAFRAVFSAVPEPGTAMLFASGLAAVAARRRRSVDERL